MTGKPLGFAGHQSSKWLPPGKHVTNKGYAVKAPLTPAAGKPRGLKQQTDASEKCLHTSDKSSDRIPPRSRLCFNSPALLTTKGANEQL